MSFPSLSCDFFVIVLDFSQHLFNIHYTLVSFLYRIPNLGTTDILSQIFLVLRACPEYCRMFSSIHELCLLDTISDITPRSWQPKIMFRHCHMSPKEKITSGLKTPFLEQTPVTCCDMRLWVVILVFLGDSFDGFINQHLFFRLLLVLFSRSFSYFHFCIAAWLFVATGIDQYVLSLFLVTVQTDGLEKIFSCPYRCSGFRHLGNFSFCFLKLIFIGI